MSSLKSEFIKGNPDFLEKYRLCPLWGFLLFNKIGILLNKDYDWIKKYPIAVWFGSTTGQDNLWENPSLLKNTRYQIVKLSHENPDFIKAGFTDIVQYARKRYEKYDKTILEKVSKVVDLEQIKYKYIVIADGNVSTYGYFWVLASGSVPLKQESDHVQYFEKWLEPFVHYVPIKRDFSDLLEKIEWLRENDNKAKEIANNARNFAKDYFNLEKFQDELFNSLTS